MDDQVIPMLIEINGHVGRIGEAVRNAVARLEQHIQDDKKVDSRLAVVENKVSVFRGGIAVIAALAGVMGAYINKWIH